MTTKPVDNLENAIPSSSSIVANNQLPTTTSAPALASVGPTSPVNFISTVGREPLIIIGALIGALVFIIPILAGCLILLKRRVRRRKLENMPPSESEIRTLISTESRDEDDKPPPFKKPFDIENPAPVYLGKRKANVPTHLKTLHLLSRSGSNSSSTSTLVSKTKDTESNNPRIYITQPTIPSYPVTGGIYYKHDNQAGEALPNKRLKAASTQTLPDGFESFIYSLRSPQAVEADLAKRLSLVSAISTIRFARDSQGWAVRRASLNSIGHSTVFDDNGSNTTGSPGKEDSPNQKRHSQKSRRRLSKPLRRGSPGSPSAVPKFDDIEEEITYQPTPLAPPPAQIRSRSVTPNASMMEYSMHMSDYSMNAGRHMRPPGLDAPAVAVKGSSMSILHSAVAKGKISRQEAENVIGMRLAMTP